MEEGTNHNFGGNEHYNYNKQNYEDYPSIYIIANKTKEVSKNMKFSMLKCTCMYAAF